MKILLINSPWIREKDIYGVKAGARWPSIRPKKETLQYYPFPFFMAYATAVLKERGYDAKLKDAVADELNFEQALQYVYKYKPDICVVETATPSIKMDLEFARKVKEKTKAVIVLSGAHASALPYEVLDNDYTDFALIGEYDYTLPELIDFIESKGDFHKVDGIAFKENNKIIVNKRRALIENLDELPYPERDDIPIEKYTDPTCKKYPNICIISSRGCPYNCIFCVEPSVYYGKPNYRVRSPENVVDEIEFVMKKYDMEEIYFDDASFTIDNRRVRAICEEILRRNLKVDWSCMADVKTDFETLKLMKKAGCYGVKFGVESAVPEILKLANKSINLSQVKEFVRNCKKLGIYTHGTFMFGLPGETKETILKTLEFAFSLKLTTAQFSVATPFPGTRFFEMAKENNWLITDDWSKFEGGGSPVISYPQCSPEDILYGIKVSKKKKLLRVATNPVVFAKYVRKIVKMEGINGLIRELWQKGSFVLFNK